VGAWGVRFRAAFAEDGCFAMYLMAVLQNNDPDGFFGAVGQLVQERGMSAIAERAGGATCKPRGAL
jgi:DNA-binding phage protein